MPGDLTIKGRVVRAGGQFSTAEAFVYDAEGKLLASGRGTYFTAPPKAWFCTERPVRSAKYSVQLGPFAKRPNQ